MATAAELKIRVQAWQGSHGYLAEHVYDIFTNRREHIAEFFPDLDLATVVEGAARWAEYQERLREEEREC